MGESDRAARRGQRVAVGDLSVVRRADLVPTFRRVVEVRPANPRAMGPFPARPVQGYRVEVAAVEERDEHALNRAWPPATVVPVALAEASPKAVPIEDLLVWTYKRQRAHTGMMGADDLQQLYRSARGRIYSFDAEGRVAGWTDYDVDGRSTDGCAAIAERAALGVERVDGGGYRLNRVHADAETVHERVERLGPAQRRLIIRAALTGEAPPWSAHRPKLGPMVNSKGVPRFRYDERRNPIACLLEWDVEPEHVRTQNSNYSLWHAALVSLADTLSAPGLLVLHVVGPPRALAAPWQTVDK